MSAAIAAITSPPTKIRPNIHDPVGLPIAPRPLGGRKYFRAESLIAQQCALFEAARTGAAQQMEGWPEPT